MFQFLCILPTRRCSETRLKHSISAGVILHLSLAIIFEVSMREVEDQICQHSATLYLQQPHCDQDHHHHQGAFPTYNRTGRCLPTLVQKMGLKQSWPVSRNYDGKGGRYEKRNEKPLSVSNNDSFWRNLRSNSALINTQSIQCASAQQRLTELYKHIQGC
jgi:hypothetical protein